MRCVNTARVRIRRTARVRVVGVDARPTTLARRLALEAAASRLAAVAAVATRAASAASASAAASAAVLRSASSLIAATRSVSRRFSRSVSSQTTAAAYRSVSSDSARVSSALARASASRAASVSASIASSRVFRACVFSSSRARLEPRGRSVTISKDVVSAKDARRGAPGTLTASTPSHRASFSSSTPYGGRSVSAEAEVDASPESPESPESRAPETERWRPLLGGARARREPASATARAASASPGGYAARPPRRALFPRAPRGATRGAPDARFWFR